MTKNMISINSLHYKEFNQGTPSLWKMRITDSAYFVFENIKQAIPFPEQPGRDADPSPPSSAVVKKG